MVFTIFDSTSLLRQHLPSFTTFALLIKRPNIGLRHAAPYPVCNKTGRYYNFGPFEDDFDRFGPNPYEQPDDFRFWHAGLDFLTLEGCQGISSTLIPGIIGAYYHLQHISKYAAACEPCQDSEDSCVAIFTVKGDELIHHPRYHPLHYRYPSRGARSRPERIKHLTYFNAVASWDHHLPTIVISEESLASCFFEIRPTAEEIWTTLSGADQVVTPV